MSDDDDDEAAAGGNGTTADGTQRDAAAAASCEADDGIDMQQLDVQIKPELKGTSEYRELKQLLRLQRKQEKQRNKERIVEKHLEPVVHSGYKCDNCGCEPIIGVRWKCAECPDEVEVDLCSACKDCGFATPTHPKYHQMIEISEAEHLPYYLDASSGHNVLSEESLAAAAGL
eukprot:TRINITY_DN3898_c0_g2_i1.p2 TRINITY_DN3898_c0_g2~~TRINITY_DN3898_c0_g2_i1.p2  ORF type:complete len:173 (-),score=71.45 TRINITY_DN3898_c0_g2_i1:176-694(-)